MYQKDLKTKKSGRTKYLNNWRSHQINRILKYKNSDIKIKNAQKIIGTRNRIAHEYDSISDEVIWTIIIKELPYLKKEINELKK